VSSFRILIFLFFFLYFLFLYVSISSLSFLYNCLQCSLSAVCHHSFSYFLFLIVIFFLILMSFHLYVSCHVTCSHTFLINFISSVFFLSTFCFSFQPTHLFILATDLFYFIQYVLCFLLVSLILLFWTYGLNLKNLAL